MINPNLSGFEPLAKMESLEGEALEKQLREPDHERFSPWLLPHSVDRIHELTKIDRWFLASSIMNQMTEGIRAKGVASLSAITLQP